MCIFATQTCVHSRTCAILCVPGLDKHYKTYENVAIMLGANLLVNPLSQNHHGMCPTTQKAKFVRPQNPSVRLPVKSVSQVCFLDPPLPLGPRRRRSLI